VKGGYVGSQVCVHQCPTLSNMKNGVEKNTILKVKDLFESDHHNSISV